MSASFVLDVFHILVNNNGQTLSIGRFCDEISTVEHEILHALGFFHEQSRYDRDDFVTILFKNIKEGFTEIQIIIFLFVICCQCVQSI